MVKPTRQTIAVTVLIETENPKLWPDNITMRSAADAEALRAAIIAELPKLTRVVALMGAEEARLLHWAHNQAAAEAGLAPAILPPNDYVAPPDRRKKH